MDRPGAGGERRDGCDDVRHAVAILAERLPAPLEPLARLAYNYQWSWLPGGPAAFRDIDPLAWRRGGENPRFAIEATPPHRLRLLASDPRYVARVQALAATVDRALARGSTIAALSPKHPVAYFCAEFAVHASLPLYGGGLGVLAGDLLKAASDLAVPMVGVGLLYRQGYFRQRLDPAGWQHEYWTDTHFDRLPLVRVTALDGRPLTVKLALRGREIRIHVWRVDVGSVPLYLLDTDLEENHPIDRWITARLYIGDRQTRLAQYAVLGVGGARALAAMGYRPAVVHLNEGHAALSGLERIRELLDTGVPFDTALARLRAGTVFTTHTPVAAGNEGYTEAELEPVLGDYVRALGVAPETIYDLARVDQDRSQPIGMTPLALRTSRASNGVSRRHGEVARAMWHGLRSDGNAVAIRHVTNGVHTATWMGTPMQALLDRHLGADWRLRLGDTALWDAVLAIPDQELWEARCAQRLALVEYVRERSVRDRLARGEPMDYVEQAARVFEPGAITVGFARRVATYKRLHLLTRHPDRARRLLELPGMPAQLVIAGKAHPQDDEAKHTLHEIFGAKAAPVVGAHVAFLEDYDLDMSTRLVAGVDVWLNLPRPPLEASGTSGMKVALNGGLNLSVLDGWWEEAWDGENGWAIDSPDADPVAQDEHDAVALYDLLEREVIPLFYDRGPDGLPHRWLARTKAAMRTLIPGFTAERMLREYVGEMYATPAA